MNKIIELLKRELNVEWISINKLVTKYDIEVDIDDLINTLLKLENIEVMYSVVDNEFYVRRKVKVKVRENNLNMQSIVNKVRNYLKEPIPKPQFIELIRNVVDGKEEVLYNVLLRDGVIEEVMISGMVFVKLCNY